MMAENSKIEWCDHSSSPWHGCQHAETPDGQVHPGCLNCYAELGAKRNPKTLGEWGPEGTRIKSKSFIRNLRLWNKQAANEGRRVTVFPSICDPFEDRPELVPWRQEMFAVIDECPNVILLLLTKRPHNVRRMWAENRHTFTANDDSRFTHRPNVWLGTSISDQHSADQLVPLLLQCHDLCPVLFLSAEPLVGPVDLRSPYYGLFPERRVSLDTYAMPGGEPDDLAYQPGPRISWVIVGGESGHHARPMHPDWARSLRDQCQAAGVAFFFKQWGEWQNGSHNATPNTIVLSDGRHGPTPQAIGWSLAQPNAEKTWHGVNPTAMSRVGKATAGRLLDGRTWDEFPEAVEVTHA